MSPSPRTGFDYLDAVVDPPGSVLAMAHRGGATHPELAGLENTMAAFEHAVALGYRYLETDVHVTCDGELLAFHDEDLARVTNGTGLIAELTASEVAKVRIADEHDVPTMAQLLEAFPDCRFNIDIKARGAVPALAQLVARHGAHSRVCVGSFSHSRLREFRRLTAGRVATSASPLEVATFLSAPFGQLARSLTRGHVAALQVPHRSGPLPVVTRSLVRRAHAAGAHVHVWTIDDPEEIRELLDLGVDGIFTDRTDLLKDVLIERGLWRDPS